MSVKDFIVGFRVDEEEKKHLEAKAKQEKRKLSDFMRCELLKDKNYERWNKT